MIELELSELKIKEYTDPKDIERIELIAESIRDQGLINPITVYKNTVIAGGKRARAAILLGHTKISCTIIEREMDENEVKSLSLHENLKRYNLPWYEQVILEKELHTLRQEEHGVKDYPRARSGWSLRDTAAELKISFGVLSEDLRMADAIIADPSLKGIKDKNTARKVILTALRRANQEIEANRETNEEINVAHCGEASKVLQLYTEKTFDACITDPPWMKFKDDNLTKDEFTLNVFEGIYRVLKPDSFLYAFVSTKDFYEYSKELPRFGFKVQEIPLIWIKEGVLTHGARSWEYQRDHELILLAVKGTPALTSPMLSSTFSCKVIPSLNLIHPNEKPTAILKKIIDHCTYENAIILDPFAGSGSLAIAARETNRRWVLIERDQEIYQKILNRIKEKK